MSGFSQFVEKALEAGCSHGAYAIQEWLTENAGIFVSISSITGCVGWLKRKRPELFAPVKQNPPEPAKEEPVKVEFVPPKGPAKEETLESVLEGESPPGTTKHIWKVTFALNEDTNDEGYPVSVSDLIRVSNLAKVMGGIENLEAAIALLKELRN